MVLRDKPLIVVVDDNPRNIQVLANLLAENNYEPAVFLDGQDALDFIIRERPDLILLDIMMPEMDGYEVCRILKKRSDTKGIPIIFITAKTETNDIVKGFEVGAVDYVTKPFNNLELLARVKTHVEMKILQGLLPICAKCKKIRDEEGIWEQIEIYLQKNSDALFSHSLCPQCSDELYGHESWYESLNVGKNNEG
jgi:DNA-binding response OmpR family regulator